MNTCRFMVPVLLYCLAGVAPASAYASGVADGVYSGTSQDGQSVSFTVGTDDNGNTAIISVSTSYAALCKNGMTANAGSGFDPDAVLSGNKVSYVESYIYLYQKVSADFKGDTMTGKIYSETPAIVGVSSGVPKKVVLCESATQTFSATLSNASSVKFKAQPVYSGRY